VQRPTEVIPAWRETSIWERSSCGACALIPGGWMVNALRESLRAPGVLIVLRSALADPRVEAKTTETSPIHFRLSATHPARMRSAMLSIPAP
jgi:hypothetical protein